MQRGKSTLKYYEDQIALARVTLPSSWNGSRRTPTTRTQRLNLYAMKGHTQAITPQSRTDPDAATKRVDVIRGFLNRLKTAAKPQTTPSIDRALARVSSVLTSIEAEEGRTQADRPEARAARRRDVDQRHAADRP